MAKNQSKKQDKTIKAAAIAFAAFILVVGTVLFINNRQLSYVATVDGVRIPTSHFDYQVNQLLMHPEAAELIHWFGWSFFTDMALDSLVDLYVVVARGSAEPWNVELTQEQANSARDFARQVFDDERRNGDDLLRLWGFTRSSFVEFYQKMDLYQAIRWEIMQSHEMPEEEFEAAVHEFIWGDMHNIADFVTAFVYAVQVSDEELADELFARLDNGESIQDIIHYLNEEWEAPDAYEDEEEAVVITVLAPTGYVNAANTHMTQDQWFGIVNEAEPGNTTGLMPLGGGMFGFFELVRVDVDELDEESLDHIRAEAEWVSQQAFFNNLSQMWVADVVAREAVVRNTRVLEDTAQNWSLGDIMDEDGLDN